MPTISWADGWHHRTADTNRFGGATDTGIFSTVTRAAGISFDNETYQGAPDLQVVEDGTTTCVERGVPAGNRIAVVSVYFKLPSGAPAAASRIMQIFGPTNTIKIWIETSGTISAGDTSGDKIGPNVNDGAIHRLDARFDWSAATFTVDWAVDGVNQTQATLATQTPADITVWRLGGTTSNNVTVRFWHFALSLTSGDYPIGDHRVNVLLPTGDGTHVAGTNTIEDQAGTDIVSPNAFPLLDEWPANTSDYIQQSTVGGTNYAEVTFADTTETTIWFVRGTAALFASGTTANDGITRIVDSGGTTLTDVYSGDMSENPALHYRASAIAVPGGGSWDQTKLNGLKARVGFSTNVASVPRWTALSLQYVVPGLAALVITGKNRVITNRARW